VRTRTAVVAVAMLLFAAPAALAHQGNPNYRSEVKRITPATSGVTVTVLNYDDRLQLENTSGTTVVVEDYEDKPYARVLGDGTVQVNTNSKAYYLDDDRFAEVAVPDGLGDTPNWKSLSKTGRFEWHDHRMHWMSKSDPPQLKDKDVRTHILDWKVPITVDGEPGAIAGSLTWVPLPGGSMPLGAIFGLAALIIACLIAVAIVRRRREPQAGDEPAGKEAAEAW
jgi:hypothetical protein